MRLGILADIHSHYRELEIALEILRVQGVDGILTLGESIEALGCLQKAGYTADLPLEYGCKGFGATMICPYEWTRIMSSRRGSPHRFLNSQKTVAQH